MNEIEEIDVVNIENLIYEIRGHQVMLNSDVSVTKCNGNMITHCDIGKPAKGYSPQNLRNMRK